VETALQLSAEKQNRIKALVVKTRRVLTKHAGRVSLYKDHSIATTVITYATVTI